MARRLEHVERRSADGLLQPTGSGEGEERIVCAVDDRRGRRHGTEPAADVHRIGGLERFEVGDEQVTTGWRRKILDVPVDRAIGEIGIHESTRQIGFKHTE